MSQNMTIFVMAASISALFLTVVALTCGVWALALVIGLKNSTHKIIQGPWSQVPTEKDDFINSDDQNNLDDEIQDLPKQLQKPRPMSLKEQMAEYMYPDISEEQV